MGCAEETALQECTRGMDVRRTWSEKEMLRTFGSQHIPGTPDGMFEYWDGSITCVQVVRVPLVLDMSLGAMNETLSQTVLSKVVKSQRWLRVSPFVPGEFIIFGWLPFEIPEEVARHADSLMKRVQRLDSRFSLRL